MTIKVLLIDDDVQLLNTLKDIFTLKGYIIQTADGAATALSVLKKFQPDLVLCDINMPEKSGFTLMEEVKSLFNIKWWVFITGYATPEMVERANMIGAADFLEKPFNFEKINKLIQKLVEKDQNPLMEIMDIVQGITGIQLGKEKELLVETRLTRRMRILGLSSLEEYIKFFRKNRKTEIEELVSLVSTHTTEFFRESGHFDYLFKEVFPVFLQNRRPIVVWSAACSSGEECYSIAIAWCEFLKSKNIDFKETLRMDIYGTDVSLEQVKKAQKGIYDRQAIARIHPAIINKYFDIGTGDISNLVRVKDYVHRMCKFGVVNLLSQSYPNIKPDVVFLRNVLIYFKPADIERIIQSILKLCHESSYLFLGHSESLSGLNVGYQLVGNSIYKTKSSATPIEITTSKQSTMPKKVFIVDDSSTIRKMLHRVLNKEHGFEVIGEAENPIEAEQKLKNLKPDIMTLDIHMPKMDGVSYLEQLKKNPKNFPIVILSSINYEDAVSGLRCLELGAVDYIEKPQSLDLEKEGERIRIVLSAVLNTTINTKIQSKRTLANTTLVNKKVDTAYSNINGKDLILIGASTGGVEAILTLLRQFPKNSPPVLIVQHIPPIFSKTFAQRLNECCEIEVIEGHTGAKLLPGKAYVAPGGKQMGLFAGTSGIEILIKDDEPVNRHKPSVDYLFNSTVKAGLTKRYNIIAILLTGMGNDGAQGLKNLKDLGVHTIVQDEETCVVFGMPKEAIKLNGANETLPLPSISYHIFKALKKRSAA